MKLRTFTAAALGALAIAAGVPASAGAQTAPAPAAASPSSDCTITGTARADRLVGTSRADVICGLGGNDVIIGNGGRDTLMGGAGNDRLEGGAGSDMLMGEAGRDTLIGGAQGDQFLGGAGVDRLTAGTAGDTCAVDPADPVTGTCVADTTGPQISDVQVPSTIDAGETLTVTWRVTDPSGIDTPGGLFLGGFGPNTQATLGGRQGFVGWCGFPIEPTRISGSSTDGVYRISCDLPELAPNDTYTVFIAAGDVFGNGVDGFSQSYDFEVQNGSSDYDAPSVAFETQPEASYAPGDEVTFTLRGIDESGVAGIGVFVLGPNGLLVDDQVNGWISASATTLTSGDVQDGIYTVNITIAETAVAGDYTFLLGFSDSIGNRAWNQTPGFSVTVG
jgi:hypothetical protein